MNMCMSQDTWSHPSKDVQPCEDGEWSARYPHPVQIRGKEMSTAV